MSKKKILIVGAGEASRLLLREIKKNPLFDYLVVGFVDDFKNKGDFVNDIEVLGDIESIPEVVKSNEVEEIIIAIPSLNKERFSQIISICKSTGAELKVLPSTYEVLYSLKTGRPWYKNQIRPINIEDLLRRKPSFINFKEIKEYIFGKKILITGGGGSIGSELCHQLAELNPSLLIILDNSEYNLYKINYELKEKFKDNSFLKPILADIKDKSALKKIFNEYKIDIIFHAAAYKHVPLTESNVIETVKNNIFGTYNLASIAEEKDVKDFILISTDKAVNPTSVMGVSKRISEKFLQLFDEKTRFITVRFGNVLGSRGSAIPLFEEQIKKGGPITITHPEIIRYFMTIPEAVQLVIHAGIIGKNKQILVLDMGEPYKIVDIAEKLVRLYGFIPGKDIRFKFIGLRPGEKLYEELLTKKEKLTETKNRRIFIGHAEGVNQNQLKDFLKELKILIEEGEVKTIKEAFKKIVPSYSPEEL